MTRTGNRIQEYKKIVKSYVQYSPLLPMNITLSKKQFPKPVNLLLLQELPEGLNVHNHWWNRWQLQQQSSTSAMKHQKRSCYSYQASPEVGDISPLRSWARRRLAVIVTYIEPFGFATHYTQDHCRLVVALSFTATTCSHRYLY